MWYLCLGWPEEPTVEVHIMDMGHDTELTNAHRLDKATGCMESLVKEPTGI